MALGKNGCPINEEIIGYCNSSASFSGWGYSFDSEQYDFVQSHVLSVFTSENEISILWKQNFDVPDLASSWASYVILVITPTSIKLRAADQYTDDPASGDIVDL